MPGIEFGADGIRGIAGEGPFHPAIAVQIGHALGRFVCARNKHPSVVIGRDTRPSGMNLLHCLEAGLTAQGADVINLGLMTTPGVAYLARRLEADLGVIVSASHNPLEFNGLKLVGPNGLRFQREEEIEIEYLIDEFLTEAVNHAPYLGQQSDGQHLIELYVQDHVNHFLPNSLKNLKVVLDCANGATSHIAPEVFRRLGAEVMVINNATERNSINHKCGSEYARKNPHHYAEILQECSATYVFAFDGDGDRLVVVDTNGRMYDGHDLLFVLARHFYSRNRLKGNTVVTIHVANRGLEEALKQIGIQTLYTDNGDRNLEAAMWGGDYLLGGEPGGNIILNDGHHTAADAVYAALLLGEVLVSNQPLDLNELAAPLRKRPQKSTSLEILSLLTLDQRAILRQQIKYQEAELGPDSRILVWDSSTEPGVIRVMVEGSRKSTPADVNKMVDCICQVIRRIAGLKD